MHAIKHTDAPQGSAEWLASRKQGIASTDAAVVLGLSSYRTPLELYKEKTSEVANDFDPWLSKRGKAMEPAIAQWYADETKETIIHDAGTLKHPKYQHMLASLDGRTQSGKLNEYKTYSSKNGWGEPGTDQVPQDYLIQVQDALFVTGLQVCDIAVSFFGNKPVIYTVEADAELQQMILDGCTKFWNDNVLAGVEPEPTTIAEKLTKRMIDAAAAATAEGAVYRDYISLMDVRKQLEQLEALKTGLEDNIKNFLIEKGAASLVNEDGERLVTWSERKGSQRIDSKALKAALPEVYDRYSTTGEPTRTFKVY